MGKGPHRPVRLTLKFQRKRALIFLHAPRKQWRLWGNVGMRLGVCAVQTASTEDQDGPVAEFCEGTE